MTRIGASSTASERVSVSAAPLVIATASVPISILNAATPENNRIDPAVLICSRGAGSEHQRADAPWCRTSAARPHARGRRALPRARADAVEIRWSIVPTRAASASMNTSSSLRSTDSTRTPASDAYSDARRSGWAAGDDHVRAAGPRRVGDRPRDPAATADHEHVLSCSEALTRHAARRPRRCQVAVDAVRDHLLPGLELEPLAVEPDLDAVGLERDEVADRRHGVERRAVGPRGVATPSMS